MAALIQIVVPSARKAGTIILPDVTQTLHFVWNANPEPEVTHYRLYIGRTPGNHTVSGSPINVGNVLSTTYDVLVGSGIWYFALTARTAVPLESAKSAEVSITV